MIRRAFEALRDPEVKKVGWGAGGLRQVIHDLYPVEIDYLLDRDETRWGTEVDGIPIVDPERLRGEDPEQAVVIIYSGEDRAIKHQIAELGDFESISGSQLLELPPLPAHACETMSDAELAGLAVRKAFAMSIFSLRRQDRFAIYGAGELAHVVSRLCAERGLAPEVYLDDVMAGGELGGRPIADVATGLERHEPDIVLFANLADQRSFRDPAAKDSQSVAESVANISGSRPDRVAVKPSNSREVESQIYAFGRKATGRDMDFAALLAGKSVALVGPAETTLGTRAGEMIDAFDLVVRLNTTAEHLPLAPELSVDMGTRTDILYLASRVGAGMIEERPELFENLIEHDVLRYVVFADNSHLSRKCARVDRALDRLAQWKAQHESSLGVVRTRTTADLLTSWLGGYAPRTGFLALVDLLSYDISKLYVTGLTFYHQGGHVFRDESKADFSPLRNKTGGTSIHNSVREMDLMVQLARACGDRLELDAPLLELVNRRRLPARTFSEAARVPARPPGTGPSL